jgi:hypothetical protein
MNPPDPGNPIPEPKPDWVLGLTVIVAVIAWGVVIMAMLGAGP